MATRAAGLVIFRLIDNSVQYLLLKASYGTFHWSPPKGHVDPGESDWVTALRETAEEAGLNENHLEIYNDVTKTLHYQVKGKPKEVIYWLARLKDPATQVQLSREHTEFQWLALKEAKDLAGFRDFNELLDEFDIKAKNLNS